MNAWVCTDPVAFGGVILLYKSRRAAHYLLSWRSWWRRFGGLFFWSSSCRLLLFYCTWLRLWLLFWCLSYSLQALTLTSRFIMMTTIARFHLLNKQRRINRYRWPSIFKHCLLRRPSHPTQAQILNHIRNTSKWETTIIRLSSWMRHQ